MKGIYFIFIWIIFGIPARTQQNTLDYFLREAIANSPLSKDYQGQVQSLSLDSQILRASTKFQVNGISNNSYAPVIHGFGYDEIITNGAQVSAMVQVTRDLINSKTIASKLLGLQIQAMIIADSGRLSERDLRKTITDQFIITYGEQLQLEFSNHINSLLQSEDSLLKILTRDNVYKQTDYLSFVVIQQQQLLNSSQLQIQYMNDYMTLNYLSGIVDTTMSSLVAPELELAGAADISTSVFFNQFVLDSLKMANDRVLVNLNYKPKINVFADAGYNSSLAYRPYKNFGTSVGVNLSIPIYDGRQKRMQFSKIDIQERTRVFKRDFFMRQRQQQVLQLFKQLAAIDHLDALVEKQIKYTETLIGASEKLLATGDIRLTDFITALNNYFNAKNLVTQNYVGRLKIINQINYWNR